MANSLSAKKRIRQNEKKRAINQARKSSLRTQTRKFTDAVFAKDLTKAEGEFTKLTKALDQLASKRTIHKKQASRKKSRLQKRLNALKAGV